MDTIEKKSLKFISFFESCKIKGKIRYCIYFTAISFLLSMSTIALAPIDEGSAPIRVSFFSAVIFAPIFETFLFQALPFSIARRLNFNVWSKLMVMTVPFAILHYHNGVVSIVNALFGGLILGASFIVWEKDSYRDAFIVLTAIHGLHNLVVEGIIRGLSFLVDFI